jgi:hypothetical protein
MRCILKVELFEGESNFYAIGVPSRQYKVMLLAIVAFRAERKAECKHGTEK